jgi:hypothetical protein
MDLSRKPSRDVTLKAIRKRARKRGFTYTVAWTVASQGHQRSFHQRTGAQELWFDLERARGAGELFDTETGLPLSVLRRLQPDLVLIDRSELDRLISAGRVRRRTSTQQ